MPSDFRAVRKCGRLRGESHGYRERDTSQQRLHGPLPNFSFSHRRGLPLTQSNAAQRGTQIHSRNRKRFDGAVAPRSTPVAEGEYSPRSAARLRGPSHGVIRQ